MQALLDHTASRLLEAQADVILSFDELFTENMRLYLKWGVDGSSAQQYKQKFKDNEGSDANIFFTSVVPLRFRSFNIPSDDEIIIRNDPKPSSTRYCRPLRLQFQKETVQSTLAEKECIEKQISNLHSFNTVFRNRAIEISYELSFTMIDGKIRNAIINTASAQRCYISSLTSKDSNNLDVVSTTSCNADYFTFGIASLHAWIRFMEWFLHLAYIVDGSGKWQARTAEDKKRVSDRKAHIQNEFRKTLGLNIDAPKQGSGNTNDGNSARRFFEAFLWQLKFSILTSN